MSESLLFDVVVPTLNEQAELEARINGLITLLDSHYLGQYELIIADGGSKDGTSEIVARLSQKHSMLRWMPIEKRGRGLALRMAWDNSTARFHTYIDADLSVDPSTLISIVSELSKGYGLVFGDRYHPKSTCERSSVRRFLSNGYNLCADVILGFSYSDLQCGCKGISRLQWEQVRDSLRDSGWFFDTELIYNTKKIGGKIRGVPVIWKESARPSRVNLVSTSIHFLSSLIKLRFCR